MDAVVLPIGGGGLISGVATAVEAVRPSIRVIGVEPEGASRYRRSRREGRPVRLDRLTQLPTAPVPTAPILSILR